MSGQYPSQGSYNQPPADNNSQYFGQQPSYQSLPPYSSQQYPYQQYPPGYQPAIPPPMKSQQKQQKSPKQIWREAGKGGKCGIIVVCLLLPLSLCICISVVTASTGSHVVSVASPTHVATLIPTSPASTPTQMPTPVPTKIPTAAVVTPMPTQPPVPTSPPIPTQPPVPTKPPASPSIPTGVNGNPWGYDFNPGNYIYSPNAAFCTYFACVSTFWTKTNGYVVECGNDKYSHSGGVSGACSRDGGISQILYSH